MAIAVVGILALLFGAVLGGMLLAERFFLATATEKSGWRDVRASKAREPIAG